MKAKKLFLMMMMMMMMILLLVTLSTYGLMHLSKQKTVLSMDTDISHFGRS